MRQMARVRISTVHAFFFGALVVWILWALHICRGAVPGLLDDGTHLIHSDKYRTGGFFATVGGDLAGLRQHARFYEVQYALLGLYNILFGHDLAKWYLANHVLCLATGLLVYAVVRMTTGSVAGAAMGSLVFLTSSPLAEATRANFGKAEVVMTFLFMSGIALLVTAASWRAAPAEQRRPVVPAMALAVGAVLLAAVAKESGRLFGLALVVAAIVGLCSRRGNGREPFWLGSLGTLGIAAGLANVLIFWPSRDNPYLRSYFSIDLSPAHLGKSAAFYAAQNGDIILIAVAALPWVLASLRGGHLVREGGRVRSELFFALYVVAALYAGALLALRFQLSYYLYVPAALLAVVFGWAAALASPGARIILAVLAVATRLYSVPYNVITAEAQRAFDQVNYKAMERVRTLAPSRVIALDLDETSQFVQEWNLLRWFSFDGALAPFYGAAPFFESWLYQDDLRALDRRSYDPTATYGNLDPARLRAAGSIDPEPGDVVSVRSGAMRRFHCFLRGVMPQTLPGEAGLAVIDGEALEWVGAASTPLASRNVVGGTFEYRWDFFRLVARPRFLLMGRDGDGWMRPEARVRLAPQPPGTLTLSVEVPGWLPFSYPLRLSATRDGDRIAVLEVREAGTHRWDIPTGRPGTLSLRSEQWFQPSALGVAPDTRTMSYRVTAVSLGRGPTVAHE